MFRRARNVGGFRWNGKGVITEILRRLTASGLRIAVVDDDETDDRHEMPL
jgi:molybdopterin-guanine dinucleotide biosynthesis protein